MKRLFIATLGLALAGSPVFADSHATGNAEEGESVFKKCKACHAVVADDDTVIQKGGRTGPNLYGIFGRTAGAYDGFKYGGSIVEAGENGLVWNEEDFVAYTADPKKFLAANLGTKSAKSKMTFKLKDEQDAADVWAYLVSVGPVASN